MTSFNEIVLENCPMPSKNGLDLKSKSSIRDSNLTRSDMKPSYVSVYSFASAIVVA